MGIAQAAPDGPAGGANQQVTVAGQQYTVETAVAAMLASTWINRPALAPLCSSKLMSEFGRPAVNRTPHGDTVTIEIADRFRIRKGLTFDAQPRQSRQVVLGLSLPFGVDEKVDFLTDVSFNDPSKQREREQLKINQLIDEVEAEIATTFRNGYQHGVTPLTGTGANIRPAAAGVDSTTHPLGRVYTRTKAMLMNLGVNDASFCAATDPDTGASLAEAVMNAPYVNPMGNQAYNKGNITGMNRFGWEIKDSVHNATHTFGLITAQGEVSAAPAYASGVAPNEVIVKSGNGDTATRGTKVSFEGTGAVNIRNNKPVPHRASFNLTQDMPVVNGGLGTYTVAPSFHFQNTGEEQRRRNCTAAPGANMSIYWGGVDMSETNNRTALSGKSTAVSWLVARNTAMLVFLEGNLPTKGEGIGAAGRFIRSMAYRVSFGMLKFVDGKTYDRNWRLDTQIGTVVHEPEGGVMLTGNEVDI